MWFAVLLGLLMVVEVVVDKIPHVAHLLHGLAVVVHPIAGTGREGVDESGREIEREGDREREVERGGRRI